MTFRPILTLGCVVLTLTYLFDRSASVGHRAVLGALTAGSFLLPPSWDIASVVMQLGVSLFVLLRLEAMR